MWTETFLLSIGWIEWMNLLKMHLFFHWLADMFHQLSKFWAKWFIECSTPYLLRSHGPRRLHKMLCGIGALTILWAWRDPCIPCVQGAGSPGVGKLQSAPLAAMDNCYVHTTQQMNGGDNGTHNFNTDKRPRGFAGTGHSAHGFQQHPHKVCGPSLIDCLWCSQTCGVNWLSHKSIIRHKTFV